MRRREIHTIGWREWLALPDLGIKRIKVKVDTGARSSSLHAFDVQTYKNNSREYVKFKIHPEQRNSKRTISCKARVLEYRKVKSSNGQSEHRPVILTSAKLMGEKWPIEVTLTNRDEMGFRMLLGRESIKKKFLVDVSQSFLGLKSFPKRK